MASLKLIFIEVGAAQRQVVRGPGPNRVIGPSDGPAVPKAHLADRLAGPCFVGRKEVVGDLLVEQEDEIEAAPAQVEATWTARPARPVDDARRPSVPPDDVARPVIAPTPWGRPE